MNYQLPSIPVFYQGHGGKKKNRTLYIKSARRVQLDKANSGQAVDPAQIRR